MDWLGGYWKLPNADMILGAMLSVDNMPMCQKRETYIFKGSRIEARLQAFFNSFEFHKQIFDHFWVISRIISEEAGFDSTSQGVFVIALRSSKLLRERIISQAKTGTAPVQPYILMEVGKSGEVSW